MRSVALCAALGAVLVWLAAGVPALESQAADAAGDDEAGLRETAGRVAGAWAAGDAGAVEALFVGDGVRFRDRTGARGVLDARKAGAAVRELLADLNGGRVVVERTSVAGGSPTRGFAELRWEARPRGTSERIAYTLFLGMVERTDGWRVDEIRVLR